MSDLRRCSKCVMPETWPRITFDEEGICNICRNYEKKAQIDWEARQAVLKGILDQYQQRAKANSNKYDCLIGYSGGKDTAYTLWAAVKKYGMRPLAVTFDHGFKLSDYAEYNMVEVPKKLDIDHLRFYIGGNLRNAMCKKGSEIAGDFCIHCHLGVGAFPTRVSQAFDIPLQIWGEPTGEYQTQGSMYGFDELEEQDYEHYKKIFQAGISPEMVKPEGYEDLAMLPFYWPDNYEPKAIYLGNFEPWDQIKHAEIIQDELGWKPHPFTDFDPDLVKTWGNYRNWDKVDCPFETIRNWQKYLRRGFDKLSFQASKDIRDGLITREKALAIIKYEGQKPVNFKEFTEETGISEGELIQITKRL